MTMTTLGWIIISIFLVLLIIFISFFIWFYRKKQHLFYEIYKQLEVDNQEYINNNLAMLQLQEIDVKFKLQPGEKGFSNTPVTIYLHRQSPKVSYQPQSKYQIPFDNGITVGYGDGKKIKLIEQVPFQTGHLFLTNQRILIINNEIITIWDLNKIDNIELSIFRINNTLLQRFYLYIEQKRFMIIVKGFEIPYSIYKVWKNNE
ncbi:MAG: hypothetical protein EIB84_03525 [Spiroplasma poulsonii]|uniref:Uncharacterized protein n=2 Tax=Spiroplasma poulsonii TaxID=2138 RepID=A0A2P6FD44_9MOLU|nr:hypothetical protein [Spiroplasma sp. hyd1]KAF0851008.1 putative transmembrane protein [Spiroplasma poulsonii]MBH8623404.1 hypothetical protein [Spiroplasma sp. hyd1]MBW1241927.1 hypothetical protein [Spiroplasma poulsonii]PQM31378.1 hypothetical protein SMSRO_SF012060 [Spiroplasma poulsonii]PWF96391.1 hypothetical protein SMSE_18380 [Spiroplasma poulsonii]